MKFSTGDLIFDPRLNMTGMVIGIEEKEARARRRSLGDTTPQAETELWYQVMLFGDSITKDGEVRGYPAAAADRQLEAYNPDIHGPKKEAEANEV